MHDLNPKLCPQDRRVNKLLENEVKQVSVTIINQVMFNNVTSVKLNLF